MAFELQISRPQIPEPIEWNYVELKEALSIRLEDSKNSIYTLDNLDVAKKEKANLNKLKKAINDERIKREKEYLAPFNDFKAQTKDIISMIDEAVDDISAKLEVFEVERINEKRAEIELLFKEMNGFEWLTFDKVLDDKWLNKSVAMSKVKQELKERLDKIAEDISTLNSLEDYSFESIEHYKECLNISEAIIEGQRIAELMRLKANVNVNIHEADESEIKPIVSDSDLPRYNIKFEVNINKEEAIALANFCKANGIVLKKI